MTVEPEPTIDAFFAAIEVGDVEAVAACYADDVEVWHNVTGVAMDKADNLSLLQFWSSRVQGLRYDIEDRRAFDGGVVQRHVVRGEVDGTPLAASVCIVLHVADGMITHIYEYLDQRAVEAVFPPAGR